MRPTALSLLLFASLPACGSGGGSGAPVLAPMRLSIDGLTLPATANSGTVAVRVAALPAGSQPVLLECDLAIEPPLLAVLPGAALQALQPLTTLDGGATQAGFHVLCGDNTRRDAPPLQGGALFAVPLATTTPRATGAATVRLRNLRVVDAAGNRLALDPAPVAASVVVN